MNSEVQKAQTRKQADEATQKRLSEGWPELADAPYRGLTVYGMVVQAAEEALAAAGEDSEEYKRIQKYAWGFVSGYGILSVDFGIVPKNRTAALRAILNALMIGMSIGDPKRRDRIVLESKRMQAAKMRAVKETKSAPKKAKTKAAVQAAMEQTPAKATRGLAFAMHIQEKVVKLLGRDLSASQIKRYVKAILEERT